MDNVMSFASTSQIDNASNPIFTSAFDGDAFKTALAVVAASFPETECFIVGLDATRNSGNFIIYEGSLPNVRRAFARELALGGGWVDRLRQAEPGLFYDDRDFGGEAVARNGPLAEAFRQSPPAMNAFSGGIFEYGDRLRIALEIRYPRQREGELRRPLRLFLTGILKQLEIATRIMGMRKRLDEAEQLSASLLEVMPFPVVLCDVGRHVLGMNDRARALIGAGVALSVSPDGLLHTADPVAEEAFVEALRGLQKSLRQRVATLAVSQVGGTREFMSVMRLNSGNGIRQIEGGHNGPRFAVIYENLDIPMELDQEVLWRVFGMNAKESALAQALLAGQSIADVAMQRKLSKETLRNQLAAVMRKTDTSRQQDLVAFLTRLAAMNTSA